MKGFFIVGRWTLAGGKLAGCATAAGCKLAGFCLSTISA